MTSKEIAEAITIPREVLKIVEDWFDGERNGDETARSTAAHDLKKFLIKTSDGSFTLKSEENEGISETMHTHHGALRESFEKFVNPAELREKFENHDGYEVRVLDICSGLGYNAAAAIHLWNSCSPNSGMSYSIMVDMVEISRETLAVALLIPSPLEAHGIVKKAIEDKLYHDGFLSFKLEKQEIPENVDINIHLQDARNFMNDVVAWEINGMTDVDGIRNGMYQMRDEIDGTRDERNKTTNETNIKITYDAVFLDPFSPKLAPELYSVQFFKALRQILTSDGLILTYTSAAPVRSAMVEAGLHIGEGPQFGRKKGGTLASISAPRVHQPLGMEDERMIALSDAGIPFKDPDLNDSPQSILQRRKDERKASRGKEKFSSAVKTPTYLFKKIEDDRLKRRVLRNLEKLGFADLNSFESRYVVCPQYDECICGRRCNKFNNSKERINAMSYRLKQVLREKSEN